MEVPTKLFDKITQLRASAASIYDVSIAQGHTPEDTYESVRPLIEMLNNLLTYSAENDLANYLFAIKRLSDEKKSYRETINFLLEKEADAESYINNMKIILLKKMIEENVYEKHDNGYIVSRIERDGKEDIIIR